MIFYKINRNISRNLFNIIINGMPKVNFFLDNLCLKTTMPIREPVPPPRKDTKIKVLSGILNWFFLALILSMANNKKLMILIRAKYISKINCFFVKNEKSKIFTLPI